MSENLSFKSLGCCEYGETLHMMKSHVSNEDFKNEIWFLEHPPIFTLGTAADQKHILNAGDIPIFQSDRGGEVTYHGPGQLVIYFLLDIKNSSLGPKTLVKTLQEFTKSLLGHYSIDSNFIEGAPGVYVDNKKIGQLYIETHGDGVELYKGLDNQFSGFKKVLSENYKFEYASLGRLNGAIKSESEIPDDELEWDSLWSVKQ